MSSGLASAEGGGALGSSASAAEVTALASQIKLRPRAWQGVAAGIAAAIAVTTISKPHPFIYFQF